MRRFYDDKQKFIRMKIANLKIGTQLTIAFGIILVLIVVMGTISLQMNNRLSEQISTFADHPFKVTNAVRKLNFDIMAMRLEFRNYLLATGKEEKQKSITNSDTYEADAQKQFEILFERYLGPRIDVENAHSSFIRWASARESNRNATNVSEVFNRVEPTGDIGIEREKLVQYMQKIETFAFNKANQLITDAGKIKRSQNLSFAILVSLILITVIVVINILNQNIRRPIVELAHVNTLFREGNRSIRSKYLSKSELGHLSASFNALAQTIESEMNLSKKSAIIADVMLSEDSAHPFCHSLLSSLLEHTGAQMGAVYFLNDKKTAFERFECIGIKEDECSSFSAIHPEGEFGLALSTQTLQHITEIPEDAHFSFHTVGGKFIPREIITLPIVSGNETVAVISLASIKNFRNSSIRLLNTILNTLSARTREILAYQKITDFSNQLEVQNRKLETQKEELHILNKELTAKSATLLQANNELVTQKRELTVQAGELTKQNIELEMQKKQLDESNRLKTIFLSNMSHELRTPLNSVIALSGVLNRRLTGQIPEEEYSYLNVIERNGKQLLSLINDILDLSRIEAGREEIEINRFNPKELIAEVVELIYPQAAQKNISLRYNEERDLPPIKSDYIKCRHILQNVVANAVKFTETGGVEVSAEEKDDTIRITVSDTGIGIAQEHLPLIFEEFRQGDGSNSRRYGGTGLGLTIAKKYTEMLGGKIEVKSKRGEGSHFTIILPLYFAASPEKVEPYISLASPNNFSSPTEYDHSKNILLVEDSETVIIQMKDILTQEGYNTLVAHNGNEALRQIEQQVPDAMILDLMMPDVDGFEVLKRIREQEKTSHLPVIILTAKYVTKAELAFLKHNGIHQLIQKGDINKEQLLNTIGQMMLPKTSSDNIAVEKPKRNSRSGVPVVLVVEDNPDNMITIKALLDERCRIIEATDGLSGIEMARKHLPHLVLMDIALPGMNGIEALNEIRRDELLKDIPVVAVSASAMKGDREDFIALGFDAYVSKPIDNNLFKKTIDEYLS